jgi:hypothetical protein
MKQFDSDKYIRPEDEIINDEWLINQNDPEKTSFIPIDQVPDDSDRENNFYDNIDTSIQNKNKKKDLLITLSEEPGEDPGEEDEQTNINNDIDRDFYHKRYSDLFPTENLEKIDNNKYEDKLTKDNIYDSLTAEVEKVPYDNKSKKNKSSKWLDTYKEPGKFNRKWTPKKDRRHWRDNNNQKTIGKIVNKSERQRIKKNLRKLAA